MILKGFKCVAGIKYAQNAIKSRVERHAKNIYPLRDGSEKTKAFLVERGQPRQYRYKRLQLGASEWRAEKKALGFFEHVAWQVSGWREGEARGKT